MENEFKIRSTSVKMEVIADKGEGYRDEDQRSWKVLRHCAIWKSASVKTMESVNCCEHGVTQAALQKSLMLFLSSEVVSVVSDMTFSKLCRSTALCQRSVAPLASL